MAILTAPFQAAKPPATDARLSIVGEVPLHVHTGVWPWSMCAMPTEEEGAEPERLIEIDEIPYMTRGERRLAREVELKYARLRCGRALTAMAPCWLCRARRGKSAFFFFQRTRYPPPNVTQLKLSLVF